MRASNTYYAEERQLYWEAYDLQFNNEKALKILRKLSKHYGIFCPSVKFWGHNDSGSAGSSRLRLSNNPTLGLIMHEFAHFAKSAIMQKEVIATMQNVGTSHHGTKFQACLNFVNQYAKSKGYWRNMKKEVKVQMKPEEEKTVKETFEDSSAKILKLIQDKFDDIADIEEKIAGYEKRLHYFQKLYTTKIKKARRSIAAHKRVLDKIKSKQIVLAVPSIVS